jgi:HlyD family type I secretion membrane fusion protein
MTATSTAPASALTDLLLRPVADRSRSEEWRRQVRALLLPLALTAGLVAAWSAAAPLAGAVVAPAQLKVELNRKTVQHQEGGIVRRILVRDGQAVHAGEALIVIGDVRHEADLSLQEDQSLAARVRAARAEAESRMAARFELPDGLRDAAAAATHIARERVLFNAHRQSLDEQTTLLQRQVQQAQMQAAALESQIEATGRSSQLSDEELAINEGLASQGFVNRTRVIGLQRVSADYKSRIGEQRGDLAAARQRIAELQARIAQLRLAHQARAMDELNDASTRVRELEEKLRPSKDQVERQIVRAPVDGDVMSLRIASVGAVVGPRDALLDVVPRHEKLVVDARIAPQDIDHVRVGGAAQVRLLSADARVVPLLPAKVVFVSADRLNQPESGKSWFDATVEVDAASLKQQQPALRLQAGMPAEVYVTTGERTLFEYLMKPLHLFSQRALREPG